jgi:LacI family transcriptional regulator
LEAIGLDTASPTTDPELLVKRFAPSGRVTIAEVAEAAQVSKTTVSHVLSGNRPVATPTRTRVEEAVRELGYRPDGLARSLRTRKTQTVALLIPDITNPFYPLVARGLEDGTGGSYRTFICNTDGEPELEKEFLEEVADRRADGVVLDSFGLSREEIAGFVPESTAVVRIGTTVVNDPGYDTVHADDEIGAFEATTHLLNRGHRRVAMIQGPRGAGGERNKGYLRALKHAGLAPEPQLIATSDWTRAGGSRVATEMLERKDSPSAIFCANDLMALGVMDTCFRMNKNMPDDVAVVGFDDVEAAAVVSPPLTTVSNPAYETGLLAGVLLRDRMHGDFKGPARTVTLPCSLIPRETS